MITHKTFMSRSGGVATIEFALVLPFLLLLALAVVDFSRFIQAELIITNVSREGASMSSRRGIQNPTEFQAVMDGLAASMPPLNMSEFGMIYITQVTAINRNNVVMNVVTGQNRWLQGSLAPNSAIWNCGANGTHWAADGSCGMNGSEPNVNLMNGQLNVGDQIFAAEVLYRLPALFGGLQITTDIRIPNIGPILRSMNVM